jgi:hypothetical protein
MERTKGGERGEDGGWRRMKEDGRGRTGSEKWREDGGGSTEYQGRIEGGLREDRGRLEGGSREVRGRFEGGSRED